MIFGRKNKRPALPNLASPNPTSRNVVQVINEEAPWLWGVKQSWNFTPYREDGKAWVEFTRATLDMLLEKKVDDKMNFWVRCDIYHGDPGYGHQYLVRANDKCVGKNLADAILVLVPELELYWEKPWRRKPTIIGLALTSPQMQHDLEGTLPSRPGDDLITVVKPPLQSDFESLLREVRRYKLAASG